MINENKTVVNINSENGLNKYVPLFTSVETDIVSIIISNPNDYDIKVRILVASSDSIPRSGCGLSPVTNSTIERLPTELQKSLSFLWDYSVSANNFEMIRHLRLEPGDVSFVYIGNENLSTRAKVEISSQLERRTSTSIDTLLNSITDAINNLTNSVTELKNVVDNKSTSLIDILVNIEEKI